MPGTKDNLTAKGKAEDTRLLAIYVLGFLFDTTSSINFNNNRYRNFVEAPTLIKLFGECYYRQQ